MAGIAMNNIQEVETGNIPLHIKSGTDTPHATTSFRPHALEEFLPLYLPDDLRSDPKTGTRAYSHNSQLHPC